MNVTKLDYFYLDNISFKGIGRGMLKCTNQLNYKVQAGRFTDGAMTNINNIDSFVVPSVEIGFLYIDYDTFFKLRRLLMTKRTFIARYFDVDFGRYVYHEMYAHPDELKDFLNRGTDVIGLQNYKITLVGLLNGKDAVMPLEYGVQADGGLDEVTDPIEFTEVKTTYTVEFNGGNNGAITKNAKWGRSVIVPSGTWVNNNWINPNSANENTTLKLVGGERLNVYEDISFGV